MREAGILGRAHMSEMPVQGLVHIVGAGPSGLSAALAARALGADVVVYEKRHDVGLRFHGDFQGLENWSRAQDVLVELEQHGIDTDFPHTPVYEIVCFDARGTPHVARSSVPILYLVRRGAGQGTLDDALKAQALAAGVRVVFDDRRQHVDGAAVIAEGPHRADVIAAGYVFETDMANACYGAISERLAPAGYSYLIVDGGRGTLATCMFRDFHRERVYLERTVDFFRETVGLRWHTARRFGGSGNYARVREANVGTRLYVGEAAGFQDALFGFGLRYALLSGCFGGRARALDRASDFAQAWRAQLSSFSAASMVNRWLYARLGDTGRRLLLTHSVAGHDPRRLLNRLYRPARWKSALARLIPSAPLIEPDRVRADCDCTWCRCERERGSASPMG